MPVDVIPEAVLFRGALLDGARVDLRLRGGAIAELRPASDGLSPLPDEAVRHGGRLTPPLAEPHTHLDAALLGPRAPNRSGTLTEGIQNWARLRPGLTYEDIQTRAMACARMYAARGALRIRTHVDTGSLVAVQALVDLKRPLANEGVDLQVVAFPQEGILRAPGRRLGWEAAAAVCDAVGAIPHYERTTEEGWQSLRMAFDLAEARGLAVDVHCDETDDPGSRNLDVLCALTLDRGMQGRVVAGHCTSLHSQPNPHAAKVVSLVAEAGVLVVANPLDNIVLQGRFDGYPRRRGHTRVDELWAAGARVGIGHDSVMDPWYRLGTASLVDAAHMLVHYAHLTGEDQMIRCLSTLWTDNHLPWGGPPALAVGEPAQVLWWRDEDPIEVLRLRSTPEVFGAVAAKLA